MTLKFSVKHITTAVEIGIILLCLPMLTHAPLTTSVRDKATVGNTLKSKPGTHTIGRLKPLASPFRTRDFQDSDFYSTIIDNNLFRPLGWRPSRPKEPYRLIETIIPTDGKTFAQAILETTRGNMTYTVTRGDTLDADTTVIDIQPKQVTLEKIGQQRVLKFNPTPWLK